MKLMATMLKSGTNKNSVTQAKPGPVVSAARPNSPRRVRRSPNCTRVLSIIEDHQCSGREVSPRLLAGFKTTGADLSVHDFGPQQLRAAAKFIMRFRARVDHLFDTHSHHVLTAARHRRKELHFFRSNGQSEFLARR